MHSFEAQLRGRPASGLLAAAHPAPSFAVTAVATALAAAGGRGAAGSLLVALSVLTGQLSVGWCNDRVDLGRDLATGRTDKPLVTGAARPRAVALAAGGALALCVPLSLANGLLAGGAHLAGVAAAWAYNLGVKRTVLSWLPYALAFGLLPAFVTLGLPGRPWPAAWALAAGALLGTGAHAANVLPDIADDLGTGVRGLPQRLGPGRARVLAAVPLLAASAVLVLGPPGPVGAAGWAALAVTGALAPAVVLVPTGRLPFLATLALAALDLGLLLLRGARLS
ncbi:4-hydroxybenzoate polyprenyltransferase [Kitasatospora sp. MAA4]|uniref:UbiA family prenyltransferase n=1 Tax=Kitasatospora sp. MAA4 TaxID=3035093 RepID=UPI0024769B47|nr:UbiA family prenyltransferase [Kitasatospora sp. MAA4]MDH6131051.1 4-hydroxybenzoate polyprenyltransferase [Kitasatospora sp. MAA4]